MQNSAFCTKTHKFKIDIVILRVFVSCPFLYPYKIILHIYTVRFFNYFSQYMGIVSKKVADANSRQ